jgi:hypothetical protein
VSIAGKLIGRDGKPLKGIEVTAVESISGYGSLTDGHAGFTLPHLLWYPGATYTLMVNEDVYTAWKIEVYAPSTYPITGVITVGELRFEEATLLRDKEPIVRFLRYDRENTEYYKELFEKLARQVRTDHEIVRSICQFVATRRNPDEDPWGFKSARQIIERGAPHCSNFGFAMSAITTAGGYPTRTVHASDGPEHRQTHLAVEVFYEDDWHLYDPTYGIYFVDETGDVASYRELRLDPSLINLSALQHIDHEVARGLLEWMPAVYASGLHQTYYSGEVVFARACTSWPWAAGN